MDPETAARLHPADEKRLIRALEVYRLTGKTITQHNLETQAAPAKYRPCWLGLDFADRGELYRRIDLRVDCMMQRGLLEEIQGLLAEGVPADATALQAIGYKGIFSGPGGPVYRAGSGGDGEKGLPPLRQAAAHLVPEKSGHLLDPPQGF